LVIAKNAVQVRLVADETKDLLRITAHADEAKSIAGKPDTEPVDYVPACVEACPTGAIRFGDLNDAASAPANAAKEPESFRLLEKLGTEPKIYYRSKRDWVRAIAAAPRPGGKENARG